jgi:hypothetical protein
MACNEPVPVPHRTLYQAAALRGPCLKLAIDRLALGKACEHNIYKRHNCLLNLVMFSSSMHANLQSRVAGIEKSRTTSTFTIENKRLIDLK